MTFDQLVEAHINDMYSLALHLTGSKESAEDLVQDVFVNLNARQMSFGHVRNPRAWLAKILYRTFVDQWRREQRSAMTFVSYTDSETREYWVESIPSPGLSPDANLESYQEQKKLLMALDFLNDEQKHLIVLHDVEGYTLAEIEQITGTPRGTLKSRLHRGREKLMAKLNTVVLRRSSRKTSHEYD